MLVYILEDDENIRELECYALTKEGFTVRDFENSKDLYNALKGNIPDLILLDIMLPDDDGLTVLKKIRKSPIFSKIPVIIISAKTSELDRVRGLDLGADDYMCKPFGVLEMISRVKARIRHISERIAKELVFENIAISDEARRVTINGKDVDFTYKEFELLKMFMEFPGTVYRRDYIIDRIWGYEYIGRTLDVHIKNLRNKLGDSGKYIKTIRNVGYKLDKDS